MILADTLAGPALLAMLAAVPVAGTLAMSGSKGVAGGVILLGVLVVANIAIGLNLSEFGEFGAGIAIVVAFFSPVMLLASWHAGCWYRERRASPGKRHGLIGVGE